MYSDNENLYFPLNKGKDEIRLVTMLPAQPDQLLHCNLETVSLEDTREIYRSFVTSNCLFTQSPRQTKTKWADSCCSTTDTRPAVANGSLGSIPEPAQFRFQWGDFAALSYVWGDSARRKEIILNDEVVSVTENLETALRTLANDNTFAGSYKLWADAICINQSDGTEQAHQVQKMRQIYSSAWAVIAWLGEPGASNAISQAFPFLLIMASLESDQRDLRLLRTKMDENPKGQYFYAIHELMSLEYWSRLWIIQEVVMGASSTFLRYGDQILDWDTFCRGIGVLYHGSNWSLKNDELEAELLSMGIRGDLRWNTKGIHLVHVDLRQLSLDEELGRRRIGFRRLLDLANDGRCCYVRDKVFALLAMMEPRIASQLVRAHNFEPPRLFAAVSRAFITHANDLEPLRQGNPWGPVEGPTWAADWTWAGRIRFSRPEYLPVGPAWDISAAEPDPSTLFCADGGVLPSYQFLGDWKLLQCDGFILDEITGLGATEKGFFEWDTSSIVQDTSWRSAYGDYKATARALWNTLLLSTVSLGQRTQERHSSLLSLPSSFWSARPQFVQRGWKWLSDQGGYYFKWEEWRRAHNCLMLGEHRLRDFFTEIIPADADELTYMEVYKSSERTVMQRRFLLTANGCFGWGPDNMFDDDVERQLKPGDKIAIVSGCSTPLAIRPRGDMFEVLGEAYIQGFMDGEALGLLRSGTCSKETFIFC